MWVPGQITWKFNYCRWMTCSDYWSIQTDCSLNGSWYNYTEKQEGPKVCLQEKGDSYRGEGPQTPNKTSLPCMLLKEETFLHSERIPSPVSLRTQQATWAEFLSSSCRQAWQCLPAMHPILGHLLCSCMATQHIYSFLQSFPSWVRGDLSAP